MKSLLLVCIAILGFVSFSEARPGDDRRPDRNDGPMIHPRPPHIRTPEEEVYQVLNVVERDPTPGIVGASTLVKKVGGLTCKRVKQAGPYPPRFNCELDRDLRRRDDRKIYDALNVRPVRAGRRSREVVDEKKVGNLTCRLAYPSNRRALPKAECVLR